MSKTNWTLESRSVDCLTEHPLQMKTYGRRTQEELKHLSEMIRQYGMHPIDITPDNVILDGHRRWIIAREFFKWKEVPVRVRHDLNAPGDRAMEDYFLQCNSSVRTPTKLDLARRIVAEMDVETRRRKEDPTYQSKGRVRDLVAARHGEKARTVEDWITLLDAPPSVQKAVEGKNITMALGLRIAKASTEEKNAIMRKVDKRMDLGSAAVKVLPPVERPPPKSKEIARHWRELLLAAVHLHMGLPASLDSLCPSQRQRLELLLTLADHVREFLPTLLEDDDVEHQASDDVSTEETSGEEQCEETRPLPRQRPRPLPTPKPKQASPLPRPLPKPLSTIQRPQAK